MAIIPARGGSQRVPRKNIAEIGGKPAVTWPIQSCLDSALFGDVIVSTEDAEIREIAKAAGASIHDRPPELSNARTKVRDVVRFILRTLPCEFACIVYPTAVFLRSETLTDAFAEFGVVPNPDFVLGVARMSPHPWKAMVVRNGFGHPLFPEKIDLKGQEQQTFFASTGTFHWLRRSAFLQERNYWDERRRLFELPFLEAIDIDNPADLELARVIKEWQLS